MQKDKSNNIALYDKCVRGVKMKNEKWKMSSLHSQVSRVFSMENCLSNSQPVAHGNNFSWLIQWPNLTHSIIKTTHATTKLVLNTIHRLLIERERERERREEKRERKNRMWTYMNLERPFLFVEFASWCPGCFFSSFSCLSLWFTWVFASAGE